VRNGKSIDSRETFTASLQGHWLTMRHDDQPPYPFHALELWGFDKDSRQLAAYLFDNFSSPRHFASSGWKDDRLTWTNTASARGVTDRFVFQRKGAQAYQVTYAVTRGSGTAWATVDTSLCHKR
jgi:hypothetical protein